MKNYSCHIPLTNTPLVNAALNYYQRRKRLKFLSAPLQSFYLLVWGLLFSVLIFSSANSHARVIFQTVDSAFQGANIIVLDTNRGFGNGVQNVEFMAAGVDFNFSTQNPGGTGGFGRFMTSYFPEGVRITFSRPLSAIGFQFEAAECQGSASFEGALATEVHTFEFGLNNLFVGAADIGGINSVLLNGTCFAAAWSEMRFDSSPLPPPPTAEADLVMQKNGPAIASQLTGALDYQLIIDNSGPDAAEGVQINDFLPGGVTVSSSNPSLPLVTSSGQVATLGVGSIAVNNSFVNVLSLTVPPFQGTGPVTPSSGNFNCHTRLANIALASGSSIDLNISNNRSVQITNFDNSSRFGVPENCSNGIDDNCDGRVDCGDNDCGSAPDCRPPQLLNQTSNPPQGCTVTGNMVVGCLNNNVPTSFPQNNPPSPPANNACKLRDVHGRPFSAPACCCSYGPCDRARCERLQIRDPNFKTAVPAVSSQGYGITQAGRRHDYTITYENIGDGDALNVLIVDPLAPELEDSTLQVNDGGTYDPLNRVIEWSDPLLPPRTPRTVSFSINVKTNVQPGDRIRNQASIIFPDADQPRTDTNFTEHAIEDPNFPAIAELGVVECQETSPGSNEWTVVLYNKGTAFAHNVSAKVLAPPAGIVFNDSTVRFGRDDDTDPMVIGTTVPLGSTHSVDTVSFSAATSASVCKALTWRISYTTSEGDSRTVDVQVADDADNDGVADTDDNCPADANLNQADSNNNGVGDACDVVVAEPCGDINQDQDVDITDKDLFIAALRSLSGDNNYEPLADLDDDGDVDFTDYRLWYQCYRDFVVVQ